MAGIEGLHRTPAAARLGGPLRTALSVLAATLANAGYAGLTGIAIHGTLEPGASELSLAVVGDGVEFVRSYAGGMVEASLDVADDTVTFSVINHAPGSELNPDGLAQLRPAGFALAGLGGATGPILEFKLVSSTFPVGTFDTLSFSETGVSWRSAGLVVPGRGTASHATWRILTGPHLEKP
jgi:hypothetical protein